MKKKIVLIEGVYDTIDLFTREIKKAKGIIGSSGIDCTLLDPVFCRGYVYGWLY